MNISNIKGKRWVKVIAIWLTMASFASFGLFILEESFQTAMFSTWPAADVHDWHGVAMACRFQEKIIKALEIGSLAAIPLNPIAAYCYYQYAQSGKLYVHAQRSKCLRFAPETLIGDTVTIHITIKSVKKKMQNNANMSNMTNIGRLIILLNDKYNMGDELQFDAIIPKNLTISAP